MKVPDKTFMLVMSHKDYWDNKIDKIYDPHCLNGYVYILSGDQTPKMFNDLLAKTEAEKEYWRHLAGHRLKGIMYWKNKFLIAEGKFSLNNLFKAMFVTKNVLLDAVKKDYNFSGKLMEVSFGIQHKKKPNNES